MEDHFLSEVTPPPPCCLLCPNPLNTEATGGNLMGAGEGLPEFLQYINFDISQSPSCSKMMTRAKEREDDDAATTLEGTLLLLSSLCSDCLRLAGIFGDIAVTLGRDSTLLAGCFQNITLRLKKKMVDRFGLGLLENWKVGMAQEILERCERKLETQQGHKLWDELDLPSIFDGEELKEKDEESNNNPSGNLVGARAASGGEEETQAVATITTPEDDVQLDFEGTKCGGAPDELMETGGDIMEQPAGLVEDHGGDTEAHQFLPPVQVEEELPPPQPIIIILCQFCAQPSINQEDNMAHLLSHHEAQFWTEKKKLPPGTSLQEVEAVIQRLGWDWLYRDLSGGSSCINCGPIISTTGDWKVHVVLAHLDLVIQKLAESSSSHCRHQREEPPVEVQPQEVYHQVEQIVLPSPPPPPPVRRPAPLRVPSPRTMCSYCGQVFRASSAKKYHEMCVHCTRHFGARLPPGVTDHQVSAAISTFFAEGLLKSCPESRQTFDCALCGRRRRAPSMRYHLLDCHFEEAVLPRLEALLVRR